MTLHTDFAAMVNALAIPNCETECEEKAKARARILEALEDSIAELQSGDAGAIEPALAAQAQTLHAIFNEYVRIAARTTDIVSVQTYMRFALKAQAQYRITAEDLRLRRIALSPSGAEGRGEGAATPEKNPPNEILAAVLAHGPIVAGRSAQNSPNEILGAALVTNPAKSPNEILRSQLLSGASSSPFAPILPNEIFGGAP